MSQLAWQWVGLGVAAVSAALAVYWAVTMMRERQRPRLDDTDYQLPRVKSPHEWRVIPAERWQRRTRGALPLPPAADPHETTGLLTPDNRYNGGT